MKLSYDADVNAAYVTLRNGDVARTVEINDNLMVDLDEAGAILGIETLDPNSAWLPEVIKRYGDQIGADDLAILRQMFQSGGSPREATPPAVDFEVDGVSTQRTIGNLGVMTAA